MYNVLQEVPEMEKLVQIGVRDYSAGEQKFIKDNKDKIRTYYDKEIRSRQFEGETFKQIVEEIVNELPDKVYMSFDIDGLDPKLMSKYRNTSSGRI